ncbi:MAG: Pre-mRNA-processing factor 6 [Marteilia pararefringens]
MALSNIAQASNAANDAKDGEIDANYDEFNGYTGSLCTNDPYDADDKEADAIYETISSKMDERRRDRREALLKKRLDDYRQHNPDIHQQFVDLKKDLGKVPQDDWLAIPEVSDWKNRSKRNPHYDKFTPVPDSVLLKAISDQETTTKIDPRLDNTSTKKRTDIDFKIPGGFSKANVASGFSSVASNMDGYQSSLSGIKSEVSKNKLLDIRLNEISDSVTGQSVVDPKGYLTSLQSAVPQYSGSIDDVKKARMLLKSVIDTNPKHAPGWIASARVEEVTGKLQQAQTLIMKGCEMCPKSEDIWLEAIRLIDGKISGGNEQKKKVCAMGVAQIPQSVKIWCKAVELEEELKRKRIVIRKALEHVPNSVKLWKVAVDLEDPEDAKILLQKAVECCPMSVDLWLALSKLESYDNARRTLNRAREKIPTDRSIWITAAKLEESNNNSNLIEKIIQRAFQSLQVNNVDIKREEWMNEAVVADSGGFIRTAATIIDSCFKLGITHKEIVSTGIKDIQFFKSKNALRSARHIYGLILAEYPRKASIYLNLANFDKENGFREEYENTLYKAVLNCPKAEIFWLMLAKSRYEKKNIEDARKILNQAFVSIPNSEEIWLAAAKLELEAQDTNKAKQLLLEAQSHAATPRIFMKSAHLERCLSNCETALQLLNRSIERWPEFAKFFMMKGQILESLDQVDKARYTYNSGLKSCPQSVYLWILLSSLEFKSDHVDRARSILERARLKIPQNDILWVESIMLEVKCQQEVFARHLTNKALQVCPKSGRIWMLSYQLAEKNQQNQILVNALANCEQDVYAILGVALHFQSQYKFKKCREWLDKALKADSDCGDVWCAYYALLAQNPKVFQASDLKTLVKQFNATNPLHGDLWCRYTKDISNWQAKRQEILELASRDKRFIMN